MPGWGQKVYEGIFFPAILPEHDLQTWLETKLDLLATLEAELRTIQHPTELAEWETAGMPLGELVRVFGGWLGEAGQTNG